MTSHGPGEPGETVQATYAATLVDEWVRCGVVHAVVSPGSRSTPLALALAAEERLALHVHHDERSAAFLALGIGLATGVPAILLTTSGTAAVELHPAVVEAHHARVPLLVCTADRPAELQQIGAPQTVDQTHLYGRSVRWFAEPGVAEAATSSSWRSLAARAVIEATGPVPGPVHLNLAFRDPLVGVPGALPPGRPDRTAWHRVARRSEAPDPDEVTHVVSILRSGRRGVVVAGDRSGDAAAVHALAAALGWPVLADSRAAARTPGPAAVVAAFDAVLRHAPFADAHRPDVVLRLGGTPASKVAGQWLAASGAAQVAIEPHGAWLDPDRTAADVVAGDPTTWCVALTSRLASSPAAEDPSWAASWASSWAAAEEEAQAAIGSVTGIGGRPTEPAIARSLVACLPAGTTLVVSSSMPVRDVEWYAAPRAGLRVLGNRGANGIDGVVSTAVGVAIGGDGPTVLLIGDIAFLYDTNGLLALARRGLDLTIVVVDNRGGGIFSFLPQGREVSAERFELLFGTPHDVDLPALVEAHGLPVQRIEEMAAFAPAVATAVEAGGTRVVVVPTDRASNVAVHDRLHTEVARRLEAGVRQD